MPEFNHLPNWMVLQSLQRFTPKDNDQGNNLCKAVRLWYSLRHLSNISKEFKQQEWLDFLYKKAATNLDKRPKLLPDCISGKTMQEVLFDRSPCSQEQWDLWQQEYFHAHSQYPAEQVRQYLDAMEFLRPFDVTGKTIRNDLKHLVTKGYLEASNGKFRLAEHFPALPLPESMPSSLVLEAEASDSIFLAEDFDSYHSLFARPIAEVQRFYIHGEYRSLSGEEDDYNIGRNQKVLREVWDQPKTPLVELKYASASQQKTYQIVIYPLLIHYYQRAFYLCGYGLQKEGSYNWHNYRIDRIAQIKLLPNPDASVTQEMRDFHANCDDHEAIEEIHRKWESAYGCDFYQSPATVLLRFDRDFHDRYIQNTFRHQTFKQFPVHRLEEILGLQQPLNEEGQTAQQRAQSLLNGSRIALARSQAHPHDAYYFMRYRLHDNSVLMRLRAWSPNVEVLFPLSLRQRMAADIQRAGIYYQD
jgi:CRISPR-associated protein (TIGR03985 family)